MAQITIEYEDGTVAWWTVPDEEVDHKIEPVLGTPEGMKA